MFMTYVAWMGASSFILRASEQRPGGARPSSGIMELYSVLYEPFLCNIIRPLFREHKMDRTFGLALLHRHLDLYPDERLVQISGHIGSVDESIH